MKNGFTQAQIAKDLQITPKAVSLYVYGKSTSRFFDEWLITYLGEPFYKSLKKA